MEEKLEDLSFTIVNDQGLEVKCDVLSLVTPAEGEEFFDPYVLYTDYTLDDQGRSNIYVAQIHPSGDDYELIPVENYDDIESIKKEIERLFNEENSTIE